MTGRTTVADEMLPQPRVLDADATVAQMRTVFEDAKTNCGLIVEDGRLLAVVLRDDLAGATDDTRAVDLGTLEGRTAPADDDVEVWRQRMLEQGVRRLAVIDEGQRLLGLLCLKRTGDGFCSPGDVSCRAAEVEPLRAATGGWLPPAYDAVILTGGEARRMNGADKTMMKVGAAPIVERILGGLADARERIVVGREVTGGPVAAIVSALPRVRNDIVVVLAGDMPFVTGALPGLLKQLVSAPSSVDAAVLVADGHRQYLAAAWRTQALRRRIAALGNAEGVAVRRLYDGDVLEVEDMGEWSFDVDLAADLERARERALNERVG